MSLDLREAKAQLKQSLHNEELVAGLSNSCEDLDPLLFWIMGDAIGMAMLKSDSKEIYNFVVGLQGTLFSGSWDSPKNIHEEQIELFSDQAKQRIGADRITRENVEIRLSEMNLTDLLVILYELRTFSIEDSTRKRVVRNIGKTIRNEKGLEKLSVPIKYLKKIIGDETYN